MLLSQLLAVPRHIPGATCNKLVKTVEQLNQKLVVNDVWHVMIGKEALFISS